MADSQGNSESQNDAQNSDPKESGAEAVGAVYAKALLGATTTAGNRDAVLEELDSLIDDVLAELPKFAATITSMRVSHEERLSLFEKAFAGKMNSTLLTFLKVLSKNNRLDCLSAIREQAHRLDNAERGRIEALVITAEDISPDDLARIKGSLEEKLGGEFVLTTKTDPTLIGGLVIRVGDTVYDGSLANQLERVRKSAITRTAQEIRQSVERFAAGV